MAFIACMRVYSCMRYMFTTRKLMRDIHTYIPIESITKHHRHHHHLLEILMRKRILTFLHCMHSNNQCLLLCLRVNVQLTQFKFENRNTKFWKISPQQTAGYKSNVDDRKRLNCWTIAVQAIRFGFGFCVCGCFFRCSWNGNIRKC